MHALVKPLLAACAAAVALATPAIEQRRAAPGNDGVAIVNCVSPEWIHFGRDDRSATLDDEDHREFRLEAMRRYPVLQGDDFPTSRTILWQPADGEALFIATIEHPSKPGEACYVATFMARRFELTRRVRAKYLGDPAASR